MSLPSHRPGSGLPPSPTLPRQMILPDAWCSLCRSSLPGVWERLVHPLGYLGRALGSEVHLVSGGCPSRRDPEDRAATSPSSTLPSVLLCILAVHNPRRVVRSGGSRRHSGLCFQALSQSLYLSRSQEKASDNAKNTLILSFVDQRISSKELHKEAQLHQLVYNEKETV